MNFSFTVGVLGPKSRKCFSAARMVRPVGPVSIFRMISASGSIKLSRGMPINAFPFADFLLFFLLKTLKIFLNIISRISTGPFKDGSWISSKKTRIF